MTPIVSGGGSRGGSQAGAPRLVGPLPILFSDLPNSGDTHNLVTLAVGSAVIDWWIDPDTVVPFDPDDSDMSFGQGVGWVADGAGQIGRFNNLAISTIDAHQSVVSNYRKTLAGAATKSALLVTQDASPVQAKTFGGGVPYTAGSIQLYFLVAAPPFATS